MTPTEMNGGCTPCAIEIQNNMLSFPTMDGLVIINPKEAKTIFPEGDIYIDEITSQGKPIEFLTKNNDLNSNVKELQFKLGYSAWCNSENINLSYQLNDGTPWINLEAKNNGQITISNLVPGAYTLRIRKMDGFGVSNFTYKTIQFNIETPWYSSWWFYLLCAGFIYTLSNIYINYRNRKFIQRQEELKLLVNQKTQELKEQNEILEKNNDIKTRLISIISHDIITPLKFLSVAGKKLLNNSNKMSDSLKTETITEMTNTAGELQELSTNILNWIKYQNKNRRMKTEEFNLSEVVEQAFTLFAPIAKNKNIELKNEVDAAINLRQYSEPLRILIHNLLTNSFNFSEKGTISISAEQFDNTTTIIVKDQGVGMTPQQLNNILAENFIISSENVDNKKGNGLGYLIIKDLVKMIGGSIKINSQRNIGTTVSITFLTNL